MKNNIPDDELFNLWVILHQTKDAIYAARDRELRRYGISPMEAGVLFIIKAAGGKPTLAEISRWIFRKPHSVSGIVNRMVNKGLVKKTNDPNRKNWVRVKLTAKGKRALNHSMDRVSIHRIISSLTAKQRQQLSSLLTTLRSTALNDLGSDNSLPFP